MITRGFKKLAGASFILAAFSTSLQAQWPAFPTPGVPKTADGKPNLSGPAPKTADGKTDLSGIWLSTPRPRTAAGAGVPFQDLRPAVEGAVPFQPWAADLRSKRVGENSK